MKLVNPFRVFFLLVCSVKALSIQNPPSTSAPPWNLESGSFTIRWAQFSTDRSHYRIVLRRQSPYKYFNKEIAPDVLTSLKEYEVQPDNEIPDGEGYKFLFLAITSGPEQILAYSGSFTIENKDSVSYLAPCRHIVTTNIT